MTNNRSVSDIIADTLRDHRPTITLTSSGTASVGYAIGYSFDCTCRAYQVRDDVSYVQHLERTTLEAIANASTDSRRCDFDCSYCADPLPDDPSNPADA